MVINNMKHHSAQSVLPTSFCGLQNFTLHHYTLITTTKFGNNRVSQNIAKCSSVCMKFHASHSTLYVWSHRVMN